MGILLSLILDLTVRKALCYFFPPGNSLRSQKLCILSRALGVSNSVYGPKIKQICTAFYYQLIGVLDKAVQNDVVKHDCRTPKQ